MEAVDNEKKIAEIQHWATEVMELLDEVKPYRSIFYKQRVAKLKDEFRDIIQKRPASPSPLRLI